MHIYFVNDFSSQQFHFKMTIQLLCINCILKQIPAKITCNIYLTYRSVYKVILKHGDCKHVQHTNIAFAQE